MNPHDTSAPTHGATALVLEQLQLFGYRPFAGEPDPRPLPDADSIGDCVTAIFDAVAAMLGDTRLEPDLEDVLWSATNLFHRMSARTGRALDENEQAQKRSQRQQDGSEIRSVELETLVAEGHRQRSPSSNLRSTDDGSHEVRISRYRGRERPIRRPDGDERRRVPDDRRWNSKGGARSSGS